MSNPVFHPQAFAGRAFGVTGAAHGIGEAIVRVLFDLGATVLAIDKDAANLDRVSRELARDSSRMVFACCDVADDGQVLQAIEQLLSKSNAIDGWINNAMYARRG